MPMTTEPGWEVISRRKEDDGRTTVTYQAVDATHTGCGGAVQVIVVLDSYGNTLGYLSLCVECRADLTTCPECAGHGERTLPNSSAPTECHRCEGSGHGRR